MERFAPKPPEVLSYEWRVVKLREIDPGEIPLRFNDYFVLPLATSRLLTGFMDCPAGIAVTDKRLWVAHLPFDGKPDNPPLWPEWQRTEGDTTPSYLFAIGKNPQRLGRLVEEMEHITGRNVINRKVMPDQKSGLFTLRLLQERDVISGSFEEEGLPTNHISFSFQVSRERIPASPRV